MTVILDRDEFESSGTDMKVKDVLEAVASKGKVGNLAVEPSSLVVREPGTYLSSSRESQISYSAVQINVVKCCVSAFLVQATFVYVYLDIRVHVLIVI